MYSIKHFSGRVYKVLSVVAILVLILSACASSAVVPQNAPIPEENTEVPESATATLEPSPTATEKPMTLQEKVDAFATGKIEFPNDLSPEEYSAFIDGMNDHVGRQAIWVETFKNKDGSPVVLYFDKEKSKMVALPGSYEDNKEIVDQNQLEMFVKISEEPETGNLQYINSKGELVTSPNSADVNWNLRVDSSNYEDGLIDLPKVIEATLHKSQDWYDNWWNMVINELNSTLIPAILMDNKVSRVVDFQGGWNEYPCLNMLFIVTNQQGEPLYGIRKMIGSAPSTYLGFEGGTLDLGKSYHLSDTETIKKFEAGAVYYIGFFDQQKTWNDYNRSSINDLQGAASAPENYDETFNEDFPEDGNIILAGGILVKKK